LFKSISYACHLRDNTDDNVFQELNSKQTKAILLGQVPDAFEALVDPNKRRHYDNLLDEGSAHDYRGEVPRDHLTNMAYNRTLLNLRRLT
jgi:DnaJ-class molecular chaperone